MARTKPAAAPAAAVKSTRTLTMTSKVGRSARPARNPGTPLAALDVLDFGSAWRSSPADRVRMIKAGVRASTVRDLAGKFNVPYDVFIERLGLSKSTVSRKATADATLSTDQSERVFGMSKLAGLVITIVEESGDPEAAKDFNAALWLEEWLSRPNPALGGALPSTYLDTREGQVLLETLIAQMQSGAYA